MIQVFRAFFTNHFFNGKNNVLIYLSFPKVSSQTNCRTRDDRSLTTLFICDVLEPIDFMK